MLPIPSPLRWFIPIIGLDTHIGTSAKTVERVGLRGRAEAAPLIVRIIREGLGGEQQKSPAGKVLAGLSLEEAPTKFGARRISYDPLIRNGVATRVVSQFEF